MIPKAKDFHIICNDELQCTVCTFAVPIDQETNLLKSSIPKCGNVTEYCSTEEKSEEKHLSQGRSLVPDTDKTKDEKPQYSDDQSLPLTMILLLCIWPVTIILSTTSWG